MPELTVVIPTKNRPTMLPRALASVLGQVEDAEVVVVDDGSTPENARLVEQACLVDRRVRLLRNETSLGPQAARNLGISVARGAYLSALDDDNEWLPGKWAAQRELLERYGRPEDLVVLTAVRVSHLEESGIHDVPHVDEPVRLDGPLTAVLRKVTLRVFLNTYALPAALMRSVGCYDERMRWGEQTDLLIRLSKVARFAGSKHIGVLIHRRHEEADWRAGRNWGYKAEGVRILLEKHAEDFSREPKLWGTYLHVMGVSQLRAGDRWGAVKTLASAARAAPTPGRKARAMGHLVLAAVGGRTLWRFAWRGTREMRGLPPDAI
jgi:glycosyltransferase involved in cell wall biosynthesis